MIETSIPNQIISLEEAQSLVVMHENEIYTFFDEGCTRFVYANEDETKVIKILKDKGSHFNKLEADIYNNASPEDKSKMVRTKLVNGYIEQDFVEPIKWAGRRLTTEQQIFAAMCRNEVGFDSEGNLLCFDLDDYSNE